MPDTPEMTIYNEDCVTGMRDRLGENSIDGAITSIPFAALFSYSHQKEDIGNNSDSDDLMNCQFSLHYRFFLDSLFRVMKPGAVFCCHIQQLLCTKVKDGYMGMRDFRGAVISMSRNHGFIPHGEFVIVKNPRAVAKRNNLHSLMFATAARDSTDLAPAMNDYVLLLKKPGKHEEPVKGIIETRKDVFLVEPSPVLEYFDGLVATPGTRGVNKRVRKDYKSIPYQVYFYNELTGEYSIETVTGGTGINPDGWYTKNDWVRWAHGGWTGIEDVDFEAGSAWKDILEIDILENWKCAREDAEEKHVCPLQLEVIRRCMKLYTAPGQIVLDPFMGIGSTAVVAIEQGRNCVGFELKDSYWHMAEANARNALRVKKSGQLTIHGSIVRLAANG